MFIFAPVRWSIRIIELLIFAIVVYLIVCAAQVVIASGVSSDTNAPNPGTAIVVLSAPVVANQPGPDLSSRLAQAVALFNAHKATTVVVSGSAPAPGVGAVTTIGTSALQADGIPAADIRTITATNNASALAQVATQFGHGTFVIVVTDAVDTLWTRGAASGAGLVATISPPSVSKKHFYNEAGALWHQATGVALGRIVGYGRIPWAAH